MLREVPDEKKSRDALLEALQLCKAELRRKDALIADQMSHGPQVRVQHATRVIPVLPKQRGTLDTISWRRIIEVAVYTGGSQGLFVLIAAVQTWSLDVQALVQAVATSLIAPFAVALKKLSEKH